MYMQPTPGMSKIVSPCHFISHPGQMPNIPQNVHGGGGGGAIRMWKVKIRVGGGELVKWKLRIEVESGNWGYRLIKLYYIRGGGGGSGRGA